MKGATMVGEIEYDDIVDLWIVELPNGATLGSDDKGQLENALEALDFRDQERSDDRFMASVTACYVFALAVLTVVAVWGTWQMFWW